MHAEAPLTSHFWIPTFWKTAPTLWYYQCNPKYGLNWRHGQGAAPHTGNTNSLLLTCPHASNFKSFLYALPAGHSETQRSDPGFKAFVVQRYMVLSLTMHPWLQEKKSVDEGIKCTRALFFSTCSRPKGRTMPEQPPRSPPPAFHLTDELPTTKTEVVPRHPLRSPRHKPLQHPQQTGHTHTQSPERRTPPTLAWLGADRILTVRSGRGCLGPSALSPLRLRSGK